MAAAAFSLKAATLKRCHKTATTAWRQPGVWTCTQLRIEVDPNVRVHKFAALIIRQQVEVGEGESATWGLAALTAHSPSLDLVWENGKVCAVHSRQFGI